MKLFTINIMSDNGTIIPLFYSDSDYATQSDIVADKMSRNEGYGVDIQYVITPAV